MRTLVTLVTLLLATPLFGSIAILAAMLGVRDGKGSLFDNLPRWWSRSLLAAAGVKVELHDAHVLTEDTPHIFLANHVSWIDVLALAATLPRYKFVGKAELFRVPLFGRAARAVGSIPIERGNRKAAFQSYDEAAEQIRGGASVVVFAEGTRGTEYPLRQFKKGPVILAISAGVPLVPVLVYGTIEILPRGSFRVRPGTVHLHFLEPVDPSGFTYEQRDSLSRIARDRMTEALERLYGIASPPSLPTAERAAAS